MFDKIRQAMQEASGFIREQASTLGEGAKEKTFQLIEDWLQIFPRLEQYGLEIISFSMSVALSPSLEVEFKGRHEDFSRERIQAILAENKGSTALISVMNTIKTTYQLYGKISRELKDPLIVKIRVKLAPEIQVFIGEPIIQ